MRVHYLTQRSKSQKDIAQQRPNQLEQHDEDSQHRINPAEITPKSTQIDPPKLTIPSPEQRITANHPNTEKVPNFAA